MFFFDFSQTTQNLSFFTDAERVHVSTQHNVSSREKHHHHVPFHSTHTHTHIQASYSEYSTVQYSLLHDISLCVISRVFKISLLGISRFGAFKSKTKGPTKQREGGGEARWCVYDDASQHDMGVVIRHDEGVICAPHRRRVCTRFSILTNVCEGIGHGRCG